MSSNIVNMGGVRYPVIPVPLVFSDIVPKVFDKNPVTSLNPTVRFRVKWSSVNSLYSEQFAGVLEKLVQKVQSLISQYYFRYSKFKYNVAHKFSRYIFRVLHWNQFSHDIFC